MKLLLIACGGGLGSVLRYLVAVAAHNHTATITMRVLGHTFPLGTLAVNLIGCLLIGVLASALNRQALLQEQYRLALNVGLLGGFTTFSAFSLDTLTLLQSGRLWLALLNVGGNVIGGLLAIWFGFWLVSSWPNAQL